MAIRADDVDLDRDAALVERFQAGDDAAFADLYRRYFPRLHRYCTRRLRDTHDAEEAAQEALVRAYRALPTFSGDKRFYPWLRVIAANVCTDMCRRKPLAAPIDAGGGDVVVDSVFEVLDHQQVRAALEGLNPRHQAALSLWAEGYQHSDIAEELGCSRGAVDVTLHRARQSFRRRFLAITGDGQLGIIVILPAVARWADRWRVRVGSRGAQYSELASPLAAKLVAGAIAISVVGGAAAAANSAEPRPSAVPPPAVATHVAPVAAAGPAAPVPLLSAAQPATLRTSAPASPKSTPAGTMPPSAPIAASPPMPRAEFMTAGEADRQAEGSPVDIRLPGLVGASVDPQAAVDEALGTQGES